MHFQDEKKIDDTRVFRSERTVLTSGVKPATIIVRNGKIDRIFIDATVNELEFLLKEYQDAPLYDYGFLVLMPGIIDSHVHVNEPGRTDWEGFSSATRAAAAGGVTTLVDMPLNSIPPTTTLDNLKRKIQAAFGKTFVDVAFWGGVIPGNEKDLLPLVNAGVVGFKCFLCPSGVDEFPMVTATDVEKALLELRSCDSVLAFHAEYVQDDEEGSTVPKGDPELYETFLRSRDASGEMQAVDMICAWCKAYNVRCHIVHLSAAKALSSVREAKKYGVPLTVETCYHYLTLTAEEIPKGATEYKCCPPIRERNNQVQLWKGIKDGTLDMIVSDHSPCPTELKTPPNFLTAWGGISSLQFGLPILWTAAREKGIDLSRISRLLSENPAKLCGLADLKGTLAERMDADFVIWNPDDRFVVEEDKILHKNKVTPYKGRTLYGRVIATVLRGEHVFEDDGKVFSDVPLGRFLLRERVAV